MSLEWWQWLTVAVGVLGLSPAPWILGLALGRIQFTATAEANYEKRAAISEAAYEARIKDRGDFHARELVAKDERNTETREARDILKTAVEVERTRADKATDMLSTVGDYATLTNRLLEAIDDVMGIEKT